MQQRALARCRAAGRARRRRRRACGCAASIRSTASSLARAIAAASRRERARAPRRPRPAGRQSTRSTLDALALELVGEQLDARRSRPRAAARATQPSSRLRLASRAACALDAGDDGARRLEAAPLGVEALRIAGRAAQRDDHAARRAARDRRRELARRVRVRAVAEHDVEQHAPTSGSAASRRRRSARSDGSIIGCARPSVSSSSPKSTNVWPWLRAPMQAPLGPQRDVRRDLADGSDAITIASSHSVPPQ